MTHRDAIDVRAITEAETPDWIRALNTGFLRSPAVTETEIADRSSYIIPERTLAAFDAGRCVATFRSFPQELTTVGGTPVPADAITNVTVTATHRRRGLLTRMMATDLAAAKERGDVVATLIAAEYPIYGRYGFGPATTAAEWTIEVPRTGLDPRWSGPADGARIDLVDGEDVRKIGPELHERLRRTQPGAVSRDERWWQVNTGVLSLDRAPWTEPFYAVYRSAAGEVEGLVSYESDDKWHDKQPHDTADVNWLIAVTPHGGARPVAVPLLDRLDHQGQDGLAVPRRPAAALPARPARGQDLHAGGLAVGADPGCRTGSGGTYVRRYGDAGAGGDRPGRAVRRAVPAGRRAGRGGLRADHAGHRTHAGRRRVGAAVARGRVGGTARCAGAGPGRTSGRRLRGRRPAAHVQATVVPGHLLNECGWCSFRAGECR